MGLSIGLLGPLVIESEESGLGKIPKKARALLAYLAAQSDVYSHDDLLNGAKPVSFMWAAVAR